MLYTSVYTISEASNYQAIEPDQPSHYKLQYDIDTRPSADLFAIAAVVAGAGHAVVAEHEQQRVGGQIARELIDQRVDLAQLARHFGVLRTVAANNDGILLKKTRPVPALDVIGRETALLDTNRS